MPLEPQSRAQQIGQALGGFGAGLQGNLPQFQQQQMNQQVLQQRQQEQQQKMDEARRNAMFTDSQAALELLDAENYDGLVALGMNRLGDLQQLGADDPSDTQRLTALALGARNGSEEARELLRGELETTTSIGRALGILEKPERDKLDFVQNIRADNTSRTLQSDGYGGFLDMAGNAVDLTPEDRVIEGATIAGTPDEYGLDPKKESLLDGREIATRNMIDMTVDAIDLLGEEESVNTLTARAASAVNNLQQEFSAISKAWGAEVESPSALDPNNPLYQDNFDLMGIKTAQMKSLVTSMAYARAAAREEGGRFSDNDIKASMAELSVSADPRAFAQVLRDVAKRTAREFGTTFEVLTDKEFEGDFGLDRFDSSTKKTRQDYIDEGLSPEEADELIALENQFAPENE